MIVYICEQTAFKNNLYTDNSTTTYFQTWAFTSITLSGWIGIDRPSYVKPYHNSTWFYYASEQLNWVPKYISSSHVDFAMTFVSTNCSPILFCQF